MIAKIFILFLILGFPLHAQERVNKTIPKLSEPISILNKADGWYYNTDGQWIEHDKNIANLDDFSQLEFREISFSDTTFLVFLKYNRTGYYKYPAISKGWIDYVKVTYYLIDKEYYFNEIHDINSSMVIKIPILLKWSAPKDSSFLEDISINLMSYFESMQDSSKTDNSSNRIVNDDSTNSDLVFQFKSYPEEKLIRFFIFEEICKKGTDRYDAYCRFDGFTGSYYSTKDDFEFLLTEKMYELYYYETNLNLFYKFLNQN